MRLLFNLRLLFNRAARIYISVDFSKIIDRPRSVHLTYLRDVWRIVTLRNRTSITQSFFCRSVTRSTSRTVNVRHAVQSVARSSHSGN